MRIRVLPNAFGVLGKLADLEIDARPHGYKGSGSVEIKTEYIKKELNLLGKRCPPLIKDLDKWILVKTEYEVINT